MSDRWYEEAACQGMDTELWFNESAFAVAKRVCSTCPVWESCREDAVQHHLRGVWGGTTPAERETIRRSRRVPDPANRRPNCPKGHPFTPENTYERPNGDRQCRECSRRRKAARAAARAKNPRVPATHCGRGHEWRPETTYQPPRGSRVCKPCRSQNKQRSRNRRKEATQ